MVSYIPLKQGLFSTHTPKDTNSQTKDTKRTWLFGELFSTLQTKKENNNDI